MVGGEYLNAQVLASLWDALHRAVQHAVRDTAGTVQDFFASRASAWNLVGRVCFHLAENKGDEHTPFAFLATYSHRLSAKGKAQHLPLGKALQEYAHDRRAPRNPRSCENSQGEQTECPPWLSGNLEIGDSLSKIGKHSSQVWQLLPAQQ